MTCNVPTFHTVRRNFMCQVRYWITNSKNLIVKVLSDPARGDTRYSSCPWRHWDRSLYGFYILDLWAAMIWVFVFFVCFNWYGLIYVWAGGLGDRLVISHSEGWYGGSPPHTEVCSAEKKNPPLTVCCCHQYVHCYVHLIVHLECVWMKEWDILFL